MQLCGVPVGCNSLNGISWRVELSSGLAAWQEFWLDGKSEESILGGGFSPEEWYRRLPTFSSRRTPAPYLEKNQAGGGKYKPGSCVLSIATEPPGAIWGAPLTGKSGTSERERENWVSAVMCCSIELFFSFPPCYRAWELKVFVDLC